jgi:hypothetical protein
MGSRKGDHTDDQAEMDGLGPVVADFLPPPERLVLRDDKVKVTLSLRRRSVEFFKREAERRRVPCRRTIRALVDEHAERHGQAIATGAGLRAHCSRGHWRPVGRRDGRSRQAAGARHRMEPMVQHVGACTPPYSVAARATVSVRWTSSGPPVPPVAVPRPSSAAPGPARVASIAETTRGVAERVGDQETVQAGAVLAVGQLEHVAARGEVDR